MRVDKDYVFDTEDGEATLADLFHGRSQLIVYHFMYAPDWDEGCPSCSASPTGSTRRTSTSQNHDVAFTAVSRGPLDKLLAYRERMGWSFPWVSSGRSDFNFDFDVSFTEESVAEGGSYNFRPLEDWMRDPANLPFEGPGMSAFVLEDGEVFHTYSAYARASTRCGPCGSGSTARRAAATRVTCRGSAATTSTTAATDDGRAHRRRAVRGVGPPPRRHGRRHRRRAQMALRRLRREA